MKKRENINVLVTGASGFIGFYLCKELIKKNYVVFGLALNKSASLKLLLSEKNFYFEKCDIQNLNRINQII